MSDVADALVAEMDAQGITDPVVRNGIMAIAANEGGFGALRPEIGYSHTSNDRIRAVFRSRVSMLSDDQLDKLKADDRAFFNFVYGGNNAVGRALGNRPGTSDGYDFRGRGPIQLTGRGNYERYTRLAGHPEVMNNLDLLDDPDVGAAVTIAYIVDRYDGSGFDGLLRCVGFNTPDIVARKRADFERFMSEHTYG